MMGSKPIFTEITPSANDLVFFIDDTGHERFAGDQGYYGLGGCVVLASHYPHVKDQWKGVRQSINGDQESPLHASEMKREQANFDALSKFFESPAFIRIAATTTKDVPLPAGMHPCVPVMGQINQEIAVISSALASNRLWFILESSERADQTVKVHFSQLSSIAAALPMSVEYCFMPKSSNEPGLEIADFIISAASSEVQRQMRGKAGRAPDFKDVFCRLPIVGSRYCEISEVRLNADGIVSIKSNRLVPELQGRRAAEI